MNQNKIVQVSGQTLRGCKLLITSSLALSDNWCSVLRGCSAQVDSDKHSVFRAANQNPEGCSEHVLGSDLPVGTVEFQTIKQLIGVERSPIRPSMALLQRSQS